MADIPVQSVRKAFDLLSILAFEDLQREGITLTALAQRLALRPNTAHNLLKSMCATGFVAQTAESRYVIGPKCMQIGRINRLTGDAAVQCCRSTLEALSAQLNETVLFVTIVNGKRVPLIIADPARAIKVDFSAIPDRNIFELPTGRVLAAYASVEERTEMVSEWGLPGDYWDHITTREQLEAACAALRQRGYLLLAPDKNDLFAVACPVLDSKGTLLGALGCYAPMFRCPSEQQQLITHELLQTAAALTDRLALLG